MSSRHDFSFVDAVGSQMGDENDALRFAHEYFQRFGYVAPSSERYIEPVRFTAVTEEAVFAFQRYHDLPLTGGLDDSTIAEMATPRCGCPDVEDVSEYTLDGRKWNKRSLTYSFSNYSSDLSQGLIESAFQQAFKLWDDACGLSFQQVKEAADIEILFATGDHGDGSPFDGQGRVLAHAFFPPPNGGSLSGDAHSDDSETWSNNFPVPLGKFDLITVAAHEIGHSIGLRHSRVRSALMFPSYLGAHRFLHGDDIAGAIAMYGA